MMTLEALKLPDEHPFTNLLTNNYDKQKDLTDLFHSILFKSLFYILEPDNIKQEKEYEWLKDVITRSNPVVLLDPFCVKYEFIQRLISENRSLNSRPNFSKDSINDVINKYYAFYTISYSGNGELFKKTYWSHEKAITHYKNFDNRDYSPAEIKSSLYGESFISKELNLIRLFNKCYPNLDKQLINHIYCTLYYIDKTFFEEDKAYFHFILETETSKDYLKYANKVVNSYKGSVRFVSNKKYVRNKKSLDYTDLSKVNSISQLLQQSEFWYELNISEHLHDIMSCPDYTEETLDLRNLVALTCISIFDSL